MRTAATGFVAENTMRGKTGVVLGTKIDVTAAGDAAKSVLARAGQSSSDYLCFAAVHSVMEAYDSPDLRRIMNEAGLVAPDGMPLVWSLRLLGCKDVERVYGPDTTLLVLDAAARDGIPVGFYGAAPATLAVLLKVIRSALPGIHIAYSFSPPFRPLTLEEDEQVVREINDSGARILFVGLNTPKQEYWMAAHRGRVQAVMLGVGAAFDFIAGTKPQAPRWMMRAGLEWLFRLATEPRRLWKRYLKHNPRFVFLFALQLLGLREFPPSR
ncbi:MAG: WecB/TagA/CpsF family glycosyltransferase [Bryobacteraceae bacterium]|nr:WecB/TagA/CpsF family glycosyltransferase [Bryobacteraceae bacterium]